MGKVGKVPYRQNKRVISRCSGSCGAEAGQEVSQMCVGLEALTRTAGLADLLNIGKSLQTPLHGA